MRYQKEIEVEEVTITMGKPDPNCDRCNGTGYIGDLHCFCKMNFSKPKRKKMVVEIRMGLPCGKCEKRRCVGCKHNGKEHR